MQGKTDDLAEVTVKDLKTGRLGQLGNDELVMGMLTLAAAQHGEGEVKIVNSWRVSQMRKGWTANGRTNAAELQAGAAERVCKWLYPVHNPAGVGHWTLWVIDRDLAIATYYDSTAGKSGEEWKAEWEYVRAHVTSVTKGFDDATVWEIKQAAVPGQGGVECAIRCALHGLYGICQDEYDSTEITAHMDICRAEMEEPMRLFMANAIRSGQVRVPAQWAAPLFTPGAGGSGGPSGVRNETGNDCYASAVLQGWAACGTAGEPTTGGALCKAVRDATETIAAGGERTASARAVLNELAKRHPGYALGNQQDAQAFANRLREAMAAEGDSRGAREREVVLGTDTECRKCRATSQALTTSDGCDVGVEKTLEQAIRGGLREVEGYKCSATRSSSTGGVLKRFAHGYFGERADQRTTVNGARRVLEIRVQRFRINAAGQGEKVKEYMTYPPELDVGGRKYILRAVAVHHGEGIANGHYTTYARRDGAWFHANDGDVDEVTEHEVLKQQAYMLWYCADEVDTAGEDGACAAADETQRRQTMVDHVLERATEGANG